jgi:hypothetical protein
LPNNSKQAPEYFPWPEKMGGRKMQIFLQKVEKIGQKKMYNYLVAKLLNYL